MCQTIYTIQTQSWNAYETSNKSNKIWLKGLNPHISKDEWLNWSKVSKWTNSKIQNSLKVKGPKTYLTLVLFVNNFLDIIILRKIINN